MDAAWENLLGLALQEHLACLKGGRRGTEILLWAPCTNKRRLYIHHVKGLCQMTQAFEGQCAASGHHKLLAERLHPLGVLVAMTKSMIGFVYKVASASDGCSADRFIKIACDSLSALWC